MQTNTILFFLALQLATIATSTLIIRFLNITGIMIDGSIIQIIYYFIYINIALAVFNMLPISPLDGSQIFGNLISKNSPELAWKLQIYGPKILFGLILIGIFTPFSILGTIMMPFIKFFMYLFSGSGL